MSQELRKVFSDVKKFIGTKKYKEADPEALKKHLDDAFNAIGSSLSDPAAQANVKRYLLSSVFTYTSAAPVLTAHFCLLILFQGSHSCCPITGPQTSSSP